ncbi:hypothetical protein [Halorubrum sp. CBA1125]|nr:hypothetical protein [Halorubrum sp. CBA1125]
MGLVEIDGTGGSVSHGGVSPAAIERGARETRSDGSKLRSRQ